MNNDDERIARIKENVNKALRRYSEDIMDASAGYDILRYARLGYLKVDVK